MAILPTMRAVFSFSWASWSALSAAVVVAGVGFVAVWLVAASESAPIGITSPFSPVSFFESGGATLLLRPLLRPSLCALVTTINIVVVAHYLTNTEEQVSWGHDKTLPKGNVDLRAGIFHDILITDYCCLGVHRRSNGSFYVRLKLFLRTEGRPGAKNACADLDLGG